MLKTYNGFDHNARMKADKWLKARYADGSVVKPTRCMACGQTNGALIHHQEDYSEPYGAHILAFPLCYRCHMSLHCRFSNRAQWDRYRNWLKCGGLAAPCGWSVFTREHFGGAPFTMDPTHTVSVMRDSTVLDEIDTGVYDPSRREKHGEAKQEAPTEQSEEARVPFRLALPDGAVGDGRTEEAGEL